VGSWQDTRVKTCYGPSSTAQPLPTLAESSLLTLLASQWSPYSRVFSKSSRVDNKKIIMQISHGSHFHSLLGYTKIKSGMKQGWGGVKLGPKYMVTWGITLRIYWFNFILWNWIFREHSLLHNCTHPPHLCWAVLYSNKEEPMVRVLKK
jgi:hypothetical protein